MSEQGGNPVIEFLKSVTDDEQLYQRVKDASLDELVEIAGEQGLNFTKQQMKNVINSGAMQEDDFEDLLPESSAW